MSILYGFLLSTWKEKSWKKLNEEMKWIELWSDKKLNNQEKIDCLEQYLSITGLNKNEYYLTHCKNWQSELKNENTIMENWINKLNNG
jgi:curved DNA-binding protein CbpA